MADGDPASGPGVSDPGSGRRIAFLLVAGLLLLPLGLFVVAGFLTWDLTLLPMRVPESPLAAGIMLAAAIAGIAGAAMLGWSLHRRRQPSGSTAAEGGGGGGGIDIYERYLIGIGYALLVVAIFNTILTAGFIESGKLESSSEDFLAKIHEAGEHTDEGPAAKLGTDTPAGPAAGEEVGAGSGSAPAPGGATPATASEDASGEAGVSGATAAPGPQAAQPGSAGVAAGVGAGGDAGAGGDTAPGGESSGDAGTSPDGGGEAVDSHAHREAFTPELKIAFLVMASCGMSILGALFFVANSLREKRTAGEQFVVGMFWSGLAFRLGEAVLFTFAFFWLFWKYLDRDYTWLPILALFLGMFVKTGETLIFGIGKRILMASASLFPTEPARDGGGNGGQPNGAGGAPAGGGGGQAPPSGEGGQGGGAQPPAGGGQAPPGDEGAQGGGGRPPAGGAEGGEGQPQPPSDGGAAAGAGSGKPAAGGAGVGQPGGSNPLE